MYSIAILDDERPVLDYFQQVIKDLFNNYQLEVATHVYTNHSEMHYNHHIYFLDIDMPHIDGIELAKKIRAHNTDCIIIFISNMDQSVFRSFQVKPLNFIRKSYFKDEIESTILAIIKEINRDEAKCIDITIGARCYKVYPNDLLYVECIDKTLFLHSKENIIEIHYKLSNMEQLLKEYDFIKPHRSFLVNKNHIRSLESNSISLYNGECVPLSKYRASNLRTELQSTL